MGEILGNQVSASSAVRMEQEEKVFPGMAYNDTDPAFDQKYPVLLRRQSAAARLTIFEGGHNIFPAIAFEWLSRQVKGNAPDWSKGTAVETGSGELGDSFKL